MKMRVFHTKNSAASQSYKGGQHAVTVFDDGGDAVGVQITADSHQPSRLFLHTCEMFPRAAFDALAASLEPVRVLNVQMTMAEAMNRRIGLQ